jgi:hypothetical protein
VLLYQTLKFKECPYPHPYRIHRKSKRHQMLCNAKTAKIDKLSKEQSMPPHRAMQDHNPFPFPICAVLNSLLANFPSHDEADAGRE